MSWTEVNVPRTGAAAPARCASCNGPHELTLTAPRISPLEYSYLYFGVPYCSSCGRTLKARRVRACVFAVGFGLSAIGIGSLGALIEAPLPLLTAGLCVLVLVVGVAGWRLAQSRPHPGAAAWGPAVLVGAHGTPMRLLCANRDWAEQVARMNQSRAAPISLTSTIARCWWPTVALPPAIVATGAVAVVGYFVEHTRVIIDNASAAPIEVTINGKQQVRVAAATTRDVYVRRGNSVLSYMSEHSPQSPPLRVELKSGTVLYNPGKTSCYWREVNLYGSRRQLSDLSAEYSDPSDQPLDRMELYDIPGVDSWLEPNPPRIEVDESERNKITKRVAIMPNPPCAKLAQRGCQESVLQALIACQRRATEETIARCTAAAEAQCLPSSGQRRVQSL